MKPFFSIVIPALNEEKYIFRLLGDLAKQSFKQFETIVVDANSKDQTIEVARSFADNLASLTVITGIEPNVCIQRNTGGKKAHAKYLIFFDADVRIPKNFLSAIHEVIIRRRWMLLTTYMRPDTSDSRDRIITAVGNIGMEIGNLIDKPFAGGFNITVHKSVFNQIGGFDTTVVHSEDHDFVQRCLAAGIRLAILHSPRTTVSFRRFRKEGYFAILKKYSQSSLYVLLKGPIKKALFDYPMGGHVYKGKRIIIPVSNFAIFERRLLRSVRKVLGV